MSHQNGLIADSDIATIDNNNVEDSDDVEAMPLQIQVNKEGALLKYTQIDNYIYRDYNLDDVSFYEFVRCFRIEEKTSDATYKRLETYNRYSLLFPHPLHATHQIIEHTNVEHHITRQGLVLGVIGMSIPQPTASTYKLFMLSHFKPFHSDTPLIVSANMTIEDLYLSYQFPDYALQVMKNWEAIHECEDEHDAERLKKCEALTHESQVLTKSLSSSVDDELTELNLQDHNMHKKDFHINCELVKLI